MKVKQENQDLRDYARARGVTLWQIAAAYGIHEMTLIGRLRKTFEATDRQQFVSIVDSIRFTGDENGTR